MKVFINIFALSSLLLLTGCATMINGTKQTVGIASTPGFADVKIDNQYVGKTPITVKLKRNSDHVIRIELDGYEPYELICSREMSGWVFGNLVLGGPMGLAIDVISGGVYRLTPEQVRADLREERMAYCKKHGKSTVAVVMKPESSWKKIGQLEKTN